jgi:predicted site-specific integrase-resolvase
MAASLMKDKTNRVEDICKTLGISSATLYRYVSPTGEIRSRSKPSQRADYKFHKTI